VRSTRTFVAGHRGLVGSAIMRELLTRGYSNIAIRTRDLLDLTDQRAVRAFFETERPEVVFLAAAKVGGIHANNTSRWEFLFDNLRIQNNVLGCALEFGTARTVFLGSSCIYPKNAPQPIKEEYLLTGPLEPTNEPYAIAKIAGLKLVEAANSQYNRAWLSLMPTNLYGPGDNFDLETSHVLPAMIRKFHEAKQRVATGSGEGVVLWGSGAPLREFLYVDDLARAACDLIEGGLTGLYNVGSGSDLSIMQLAEVVARIVGYKGEIRWDASKPDGTARKLLDSTKICATGWSPKIGLEEGIRLAYDWFLKGSEDSSRPILDRYHHALLPDTR
jgi:GDP-L-fucose synthase